MADSKRISDLAAAAALDGTELIELEQSGGGVQSTLNALSSFVNQFAIFSNTQTAGTNAGSSTSGSWGTIVINTEDYDPDGLMTISSNKFIPIANTYLLSCRSPFYGSDRCQIRLYNVTAAAMVTGGEGDSNGSFAGSETHAFLDCVFTANGTDEYRIEYRVETSSGTIGLGAACNFGISEKYFRGILRVVE